MYMYINPRPSVGTGGGGASADRGDCAPFRSRSDGEPPAGVRRTWPVLEPFLRSRVGWGVWLIIWPILRGIILSTSLTTFLLLTQRWLVCVGAGGRTVAILHLYLSIYMCINIYMYIYICIYIHIFIYIYLYICEYIHIYMHINPGPLVGAGGGGAGAKRCDLAPLRARVRSIYI